MTTAQAEARIQIAVPGKNVDYVMPNHMPVGDCVAVLVPKLTKDLKAVGRDTSWLEDPDAHWTLRRPFHSEPLDDEQTIDEQKVRDGARLLLVKRDPGEKFPPLIDDTAEAIAYWLKEHFPSWDGRISAMVSLAVLPAVIAFICGLAVFWASATQPPLTPRLIITGVMAVAAFVSATIGTVVARTSSNGRYKPIVGPFMSITYVLAGTAGLIVTPRPLGIEQLVAAGAVLATLAVVLAVITGTNVRLHYGVATAAIAITAIAGFNMAYRSPTAVIGVQLIAACFLLILMSERISLVLARISTPYVPATGESYVTGTDRAGDLDAASLPRDGRANESIINQEKQTLTSYDGLVSIVTGCLAMITITGWVVGRSLDNHQWWIFAFILTTAVMLIWRGKSYDDARVQGVTLVSAALLLAGFAGGLIASPHYVDNAQRAAIAIGLLAAGTVIATVFSIQQRRIVSPVVNRTIELFMNLLYATPVVYVFIVMDFYQKARAR